MHKRISSKLSFLFMLGLVFLAGWIVGQNRATTEKTTIHAVAWTAAKEATEQGFEDLNKATEELVNAMPGLRRAWVGKLRKPLVVGDITRTHGLVGI